MHNINFTNNCYIHNLWSFLYYIFHILHWYFDIWFYFFAQECVISSELFISGWKIWQLSASPKMYYEQGGMDYELEEDKLWATSKKNLSASFMHCFELQCIIVQWQCLSTLKLFEDREFCTFQLDPRTSENGFMYWCKYMHTN